MIASELATAARISQATVSRLLSGDRGPSIRMMGRIRDVLSWPAEEQVRAIEKGQYAEQLNERLRMTQLQEAGQPQ